MVTLERIMSVPKDELQETAKALNQEDLPQLVEWLSLKDDAVRYQAFLLLQNRSLFFDDVYPYWGAFRDKLKSDNSYQRSIGLLLIAENVVWDAENRMEDTLDEYLRLLNDEKPITVRQCIQSLGRIVSAKPGLTGKIVPCLITFDLMSVKETMRKSILLDLLHVLLTVRKEHGAEEIERFLLQALSGEILDKKSKRQIEMLL